MLFHDRENHGITPVGGFFCDRLYFNYEYLRSKGIKLSYYQ